MESSSVGIYDLPDEVLCEIFSKLNPENVIKNVVRVCKRWEAAVNENNIFWKNIQLAVYCDNFFNCSFIKEGFPSSEPESQCVNPNYCIMIGEKDLELVKNLQCIKLIGPCKFESNYLPVPSTIKILDILRKTCRNIVKFEFDRCFGAASREFFQLLKLWYGSVSEIRFGICCSYIIPYKEISTFTSLTTLVSHDYAFKRKDLEILADGCETLSCLWILFSRAPKVCDILYFLDKKNNILKELGIGMIIQDCILEKLKECHNLEVLFAADARRITDECIRSFNNLPSLRYCSLHRAEFKSETVMDIVSAAPPGLFPQLIFLDLTNYKFEKLLKEKLQDSNKIIFQNDVNAAVAVPWNARSSLHWMYRSSSEIMSPLT